MKIREVQLRNYRNVGDVLRRVSFVDPETDEVRPLTVLVGSNGSGKTTLFDVIARTFQEVIDPLRAGMYYSQSTWVAVQVDPCTTPMSLLPSGGWILRGPAALHPWGTLANETPPKQGGSYMALDNEPKSVELATWIRDMQTRGPVHGGLLYFPHHRWITRDQKPAVQNPNLPFSWVYRFSPEQSVEGSLERQWVWQNYLDLEAGLTNRQNLRPFVETIETILGQGRQVKIKEGIVWIHSPHGPPVQPHQLPSGEQQILTLFGELARRIRPNAVLLIDEIELSLHPALQHVVIDALRRLGHEYDLQIIVSTHSMEIVNAVDLNEVINLDQFVLAEQKALKAS